MMKIVGVPFLFLSLGAVLMMNGFMQMMADGCKWVASHSLLSGSLACAMLLFFVAGCGRQDVSNSLSMARLGATTAGLVKSWDGDREILLKYRNMLSVEDADYQSLDDVVNGGDAVQKELALLVVGGRVPSVAGLQALYKEANKSVVAGAVLYRKHLQDVAYSDRYRAEEFGRSWSQIKFDLDTLTDATESDERYKLAEEILSFALAITGQIVIPALAAHGTF